MNHITPYSIWVGHAGDGRSFQDIFAKGIRAIVQLAIEEPPLQPPRELIYLRFPLLDGEGNPSEILRLAIHAATKLLEENVPTLVCCGGGMSRSPVIAAAAIAIVSGSTLEQSLETVVKRYPSDVAPSLLAEVRTTVKAIVERAMNDESWAVLYDAGMSLRTIVELHKHKRRILCPTCKSPLLVALDKESAAKACVHYGVYCPKDENHVSIMVEFAPRPGF